MIQVTVVTHPLPFHTDFMISGFRRLCIYLWVWFKMSTLFEIDKLFLKRNTFYKTKLPRNDNNVNLQLFLRDLRYFLRINDVAITQEKL